MMRNALICAGVMLAMLLLWPLAFGAGGGSPANASPTVHAASTVSMAIPEARGTHRPVLVRATVPGNAGGSCYRRYERAFNTCEPAGKDACHRRAIDGWDICEATGFWPE